MTRITTTRESHEIDFHIFGNELPLVEIELDPGEAVIAEAGVMMYMEEDIAFEAKLGDGASASNRLQRLTSAIKRVIVRESLFLTHFTNVAHTGKRKVALAAPYPGTIMPIDLARAGGRIVAQKEAFLCAAAGTRINVALNRKISSGLFGGEGFVMQSISGDGMVFLHAGGTLMEKQLNGETLKADTGSVVGFQPDVQYSTARAGNLRSMAFGGEGAFVTTLSGHGSVWLQSMPFHRIADRMMADYLADRDDWQKKHAEIMGRLDKVDEKAEESISLIKSLDKADPNSDTQEINEAVLVDKLKTEVAEELRTELSMQFKADLTEKLRKEISAQLRKELL